jgi:hypothetical protein
MTIFQQLFEIEGNKVESMLMTEDGLLLLGKRVSSTSDFLAAWDKKLTTATKTRVKFSAIRSIRKEREDKTIRVSYKAAAGIPGEVEFSFNDTLDYERFFDLLEREQFFVREEGRATPFKAALRYGIGFLFTVFAVFVMHLRASDIADGVAQESTRARGRLFDKVLELIGVPGVWMIGGAIAVYLLYKVIARFNNPPQLTRLIPPQS